MLEEFLTHIYDQVFGPVLDFRKDSSQVGIGGIRLHHDWFAVVQCGEDYSTRPGWAGSFPWVCEGVLLWLQRQGWTADNSWPDRETFSPVSSLRAGARSRCFASCSSGAWGTHSTWRSHWATGSRCRTAKCHWVCVREWWGSTRCCGSIQWFPSSPPSLVSPIFRLPGYDRVVGGLSGGALWWCHVRPDGCALAPWRTHLGSGRLACAVPAFAA